MAFRFFRRRQKLVVIVMVVLMVSFLVGYQGLKMLMDSGSKNPTWGKLRDGTELKGEHYRLAANDLELLARHTRIGTALASLLPPNAAQAREAYAVLLVEAENRPAVSEENVSRFLQSVGYSGVPYQETVSRLRSQGIPESQLRGAVARMLQVLQQFEESQVQTMPSIPRVRRLFADLNEKVDLRLLVLPASEFLSQVAEPTDEQIRGQFETYRDVAPSRGRTADDYGFGYRLPDRVSVQYLWVQEDIVRRVTEAEPRLAREYYLEHRDDPTFLDDIGYEVEAAEAGPETPSAEPIKFSQVRGAIMAKLKSDAVEAKLQQCFAALERNSAEMAAQSGGADDPQRYERLLAAMVLPADNQLARRIESVRIDNLPLVEAMDVLADSAGLGGIAFPHGSHDGRDVDENTVVSFRGDDVTVGEALASISGQLDRPELTWVRFAPFTGGRDVLFAAGPDGSLPVRVGQTPLLGLADALAHEVLGRAITRSDRPIPLVALAFRRDNFDVPESAQAALKADQPRMMVRNRDGQREGELLWRIADLQAEETLAEPTEDVRQQVIADLKTVAAMDLAAETAARVDADAKQNGLERAAKSAGLVSFETGPITRVYLDRQGLRATPVPKVEFASTETHKRFMAAAFTLTYALVSQPGLPLPNAVAVVRSPGDRAVYVMELVEHFPASGEEFFQRGGGRDLALQLLLRDQGFEADRAWFSWQGIADRTGFEPVLAKTDSEDN